MVYGPWALALVAGHWSPCGWAGGKGQVGSGTYKFCGGNGQVGPRVSPCMAKDRHR